MPFWTLDEQGKAGRIARRSCTVDYKVLMIQKFVRYELLGYRPISGFAQRISAPMNSTLAFPVKRLIVPFQPTRYVSKPISAYRDGLGTKGLLRL